LLCSLLPLCTHRLDATFIQEGFEHLSLLCLQNRRGFPSPEPQQKQQQQQEAAAAAAAAAAAPAAAAARKGESCDFDESMMGMSPDLSNPNVRSFLGTAGNNQQLWNKSHMIPNPSNVPLPQVPVSSGAPLATCEPLQSDFRLPGTP